MPSNSAAVVAVIVTHQPGDETLQGLAALRGQVAKILVVDNGSAPERLAALRALDPAAQIVALAGNLGVGAAHNAGIQRAREAGASHVLLLDQDSVPAPGMVERLLAAESALISAGARVGAVGPVYRDPRLGRSWPFYRLSRFGMRGHECGSARHVACDVLISSGTLIRMGVVDEIGPMKDGYFLEHIDTEWCLRAKAGGYALFGICDAHMTHHLGDAAAAVPLLGRRVQVYQPYRHYYLFRNALLLWRERHAVLPWKMHEVRRLVLRLIFFSVFVPPRWERLRFMLLGLWHGIRGRSGAIRLQTRTARTP